MPCRAFSGRLDRESPDFEAGVRRLMCPAGHLNQGWSLLVCVFDVAGIIVINNKTGRPIGPSLFLLSSPTRSGISHPKARGPKDLFGLDSSDVGLAALNERIAVNIGSELLKESLDIRGELRTLVGIVREGSDSTSAKSSALRHIVLANEIGEFVVLEHSILVLEILVGHHVNIRIVQEISRGDSMVIKKVAFLRAIAVPELSGDNVVVECCAGTSALDRPLLDKGMIVTLGTPSPEKHVIGYDSAGVVAAIEATPPVTIVLIEVETVDDSVVDKLHINTLVEVHGTGITVMLDGTVVGDDITNDDSLVRIGSARSVLNGERAGMAVSHVICDNAVIYSDVGP